MPENERMQLFEDQPVRTAWDEQQEEWYFSIVDVVKILTDQPDHRRAAKYWSVLKTRMKKESGQLTTICSQLRMRSEDGKRYLTDVATTGQLLRIIQSIPSRKAEPLKLWLAQVGRERIDETLDPELIAERLVATCFRLTMCRMQAPAAVPRRAVCQSRTGGAKNVRSDKSGRIFSFYTERRVNGFANSASGYPDASLENPQATDAENHYVWF